MNRTTSAGRAVDAVWDRVEANLATDPRGDDFNTAHEVCSRYRNDPCRLALTVYHENGHTERWTYQELDRAAAKTARVFADLGLRRGDRVAALLTRQVETWITALAAWRSGLVYVPLFGGFAADAITFRMRAASARAVVVDASFRAELAIAQSESSLDLITVVVNRRNAVPNTGAQVIDDDIDFWSAVDAADADGPIRPTSIDDTATLLFTSGTSGTPKACVMTHAAFVSVIPFAESVLGVREDSSVFTTADPAWAFGLYTAGAAPMALGAARVMYSGRFKPEIWHRVLTDSNATILATAPSAIRRMAATFADLGAPQRLRTVAAAGEPLTAAVANDWIATGAPLLRNGYGLSEVGMLLGDVDSPGAEITPGMLAQPIPGFEPLLVVDGRPVARGELGQVAVRRPRYQMSAGYEGRPDLWASRWLDDAYVTEDVAVIDAAGRWMIQGRSDDMIITSGHNVSPVEVENALLRHPAVADVAAVTHTDPALGDVVRAVVVKNTEVSVETDLFEMELKNLVAQHVGKYACPRVVSYARELPRTEVGKLRRSALRSS
ncbi:MAG: AMP-binding protein [Mycobacterium sp.]